MRLDQASRLGSLALLIGVGLAACLPLGPTKEPSAPSPAAESQGAMQGAAEAPLEGSGRGSAVVVLEEVQGSSSDQLGGIVGPAHDKLEECGPPGQRGVLTLHLSGRPEGTSIELEPASKLSKEGRRCVLETLSTIDVDQLFDCTGNLPRPSNFSTLIQVRW